jgi:hypothetical protein
VPESSNIEIAHKLTEHRDAESAKKSWQDLVVEIVEAVLLGVVAVATAPPASSPRVPSPLRAATRQHL